MGAVPISRGARRDATIREDPSQPDRHPEPERQQQPILARPLGLEYDKGQGPREIDPLLWGEGTKVAHPAAIGVHLIGRGPPTDQQLQILGDEGSIEAQFPSIPTVAGKVRVALYTQVQRRLDPGPARIIEIRIGPTRIITRMKSPSARQRGRTVLEVRQNEGLSPQ
jgi:hypothetical protein